jgi:hypothetical protein
MPPKNTRKPWVSRPVACAFLVLSAAAAQAEPIYMLDHVLPRGGTRGTTVEVTLYGKYLQEPKEILFYDKGLKALTLTSVAATAAIKAGEQAKAKFTIAPDAAVGEHVLRIRTANGLSEAVTFWVDKFPTVMETETKPGENDTLQTAQPIPLNCTVEGQIQSGGGMDKDIYWTRFNAGERISVEVEAVRLGTLHFGGENDLAVRILDDQGAELGRNDDSALYVQDPVLSLIAPKTGAYFIEIRQHVFYRPQQSYYRAHIGNFSRPLAIFPAGGQAGATISAKILGDPLGARTEQILLPKTSGNLIYFSGNAPTPNTLRVSDYPNVLAGQDTVASLPAAFNGIIEKPGQVDTFHVTAKKGEHWKVRVYGRTLGAPIDPKIYVADAITGKHLLDADDSKLIDLGLPSARGTWYIKDQMDPTAVFKPTADGEYILGISDSRGQGSPTSVYRIEIELLRDSIYPHITMNDGYQIPRLTGMIVPQGSRWTMDVQLAQGFGNNYKGDLRMEAVGLPRGVTMIAPPIAKGTNRVPVQFFAAQNAEQQAALVELRVVSTDPQTRIDSGSRQGFALVNRGGEMPLHFVWLDKFALAVTQPAPFEIELLPPTAPLSQNGELELRVKVKRQADYKDPIEIQTDWLPQSVSKENTVTIPAGKDEGVFKIQANSKATPGTYKIAINASTTGGDSFSGIGRVRVSSEFVDLKIAEPLMTIALHRTAIERGHTVELIGDIKSNKGFKTNATVILKHLPKGVEMVGPPHTITPRDTTVTFKIKAGPGSLAGLYKDINCEVTVVEDGQSQRQITGSGLLRIDPERTAVAAVKQ